MGKLGARELNYSSDIDLILLYDPDKARYAGKHGGQDLLRAARARSGALIQGAHRRRLCLPHRSAAAARSRLDAARASRSRAALTYYESAGQNWERAALIKARAGRRRPRRRRAPSWPSSRPFLWRKHLDFAAIQDIHSIKRQINAHRGGARIAVAGHNIKLGRGGIREIEFFAQTQQLIWGGRMPALRVAATCDALDALAARRPHRRRGREPS